MAKIIEQHIKYSVIIPHYNILELLKRALKSIPDRSDIQIIVIDDNSGIEKNEFYKIDSHKNANFDLHISNTSKGAGGARNIGLKMAKGKWLLFLDADDFYEENAFDVFDRYIDSDFDIIYFNTKSVYSETLEPSNRFEIYMAYIALCDNVSTDRIYALKCGHTVPVAKMIRKQMIDKNNILFDEVRYHNDTMFALKCAFNSRNIYVDKNVVYVVTERQNSLVKQYNENALEIRYRVQLRANKYIRDNGLKQYQSSLLFYLRSAMHFSIKKYIRFILVGFQYSGFNIYTLYKARKRYFKLLEDYKNR